MLQIFPSCATDTRKCGLKLKARRLCVSQGQRVWSSSGNSSNRKAKWFFGIAWKVVQESNKMSVDKLSTQKRRRRVKKKKTSRRRGVDVWDTIYPRPPRRIYFRSRETKKRIMTKKIVGKPPIRAAGWWIVLALYRFARTRPAPSV